MNIKGIGVAFIGDRLRFLMNRIGEKLWVKPLIVGLLAIAGAFLAKVADYTLLKYLVPDISVESIINLLTIMASSMLVIATFAVSSMLAAYVSASTRATPRAFKLVVADDITQNTLSVFIGAFIFSIISLIAVENSYYNTAGRFTLFSLTTLVFIIVIISFVRWVDRIARLGRMRSIIQKVETATATALKRRRLAPTLCGVSVHSQQDNVMTVYGDSIGYVQQIEMDTLQAAAKKSQAHIEVAALPGTFIAPGRALAYVNMTAGVTANPDIKKIAEAFLIGDERTFDEDPRFGLIALSEIASRALSPGINDPGTAIDVIGAHIRLFAEWSKPVADNEKEPVQYDLVTVPELSLEDMFDDAFSAIARDGAGIIEVVVRLQRAFESLASIPNPTMQEIAKQHARAALARAEKALGFPGDLRAARAAARFAH